MGGSSLNRPLACLFTYGTLMRGERAESLLSSARFVGTGLTMAEFVLYDLGSFPALCRGGTTQVSGELYELNQTTLAAIDRYENCPNLYERISITVTTGQTAYTYLIRPEFLEGAVPIESGCWRTGRRPLSGER